MNHPDTMLLGFLGVGEMHGESVYFNRALIGAIQLAKHAHDRRLTSTVLTEDCVYFSAQRFAGDLSVR
jgi:hypothetical protein